MDSQGLEYIDGTVVSPIWIVQIIICAGSTRMDKKYPALWV